MGNNSVWGEYICSQCFMLIYVHWEDELFVWNEKILVVEYEIHIIVVL